MKTMSDLYVRDLARSLGVSEAELCRKLADRGIPVVRGRIETKTPVSLIELLMHVTAQRTRAHLEEALKRSLTALEDASPLTESAAKALELAARLARDMAHAEVAGPHVLIGLTLVADPVLGEIPSLAEISRRSLMDAVGESEELAKGSFFRSPALPRILSRARKLCSGGEIDAKDLLAAVLSDSVTARMLRQAGVDPKRLAVDVRSAGQKEIAKTAA